MQIKTNKVNVNSYPSYTGLGIDEKLTSIKAIVIIEIEFTGKGIEKMERMEKDERDKRIADSYLNS